MEIQKLIREEENNNNQGQCGITTKVNRKAFAALNADVMCRLRDCTD